MSTKQIIKPLSVGRLARQAAQLLATACFTVGVAAQTYPGDRPVKFIIPYTPGSAGDTVVRIFTDELRKSIGGTYVTEYKPGAAAMIGTEQAVKSVADGYTLVPTSSAQNSAGPWLTKKVPYDPVKDFTHLGRIVTLPFLLVVHPEVPARTVKEFLDFARKRPVTYLYGSATSQVASATFSSLGNFQSLGVPYKGQPQAAADLVGGQAQFMMADPSVVGPLIKAGKLRALAISTKTRSPQFPDVPALSEAGLEGFDLEVWIGIAGPAGLPKDIAAKLSTEIMKLGARDDLRSRFAGMGMELLPTTMAEHDTFVRRQLDVWGKRIKDAGIQPE